MPSVEGWHNFELYATFFGQETASAAWSQVEFTGINGDQFEAKCVRLKNTDLSDALYFSFDPRNVTSKQVHGILATGEEIMLRQKYASEVWVKRVGGSDATVDIYAWR